MIEIDTSGLSCPMPVLKAHKMLSQMGSGDVLRLISTDGDSCADVPTFVRTTKNELLSQETQDGKFVFVIRKN